MTESLVPSKPILRYHQREDLKQEIQQMKDVLPQMKSSEDRGQVLQRLKRSTKTLEQESPPELSGEATNKIHKEIQALEAKISQGMLSREEMRKNPAGSVGQFMKWEKANKKDILKWKNLRIMRDPHSDDPDLANVEVLRPNGAVDRFRTDAQITGKMTYGNVDQDQWDEVFQGKGPNSALEQVKSREATIEPPSMNADGKPRKQMSPEAKAAMIDRLAKARAAKKTKADPQPIQEGESAPAQES